MIFFSVLKNLYKGNGYIKNDSSPRAKMRARIRKNNRLYSRGKKTSNGNTFSDRPKKYRNTHSGHH